MKIGNWISACFSGASGADRGKTSGRRNSTPSSRRLSGSSVLNKLGSLGKGSSKKSKGNAGASMERPPSYDPGRSALVEDAVEYLRSGGRWQGAPKNESESTGKTEGEPTPNETLPNASGHKGSLAELSAQTSMRDTALRMAAHAVQAIPEISAEETAAGAGAHGVFSGSAFVPRPAMRPGEEPDGSEAPLVGQQREIDPAPVRAWLANRGIETVPNSGAGMNCLLIALLQHATGRYDKDFEPKLSDEAQKCRAVLEQAHPEIAELDRMLYADEPAIKSALAYINTRCGANLDVHWVEPHADGHPVRWLHSSTGEDPVAIIRFGNHFEALRSTAGNEPPHHKTGGSMHGGDSRFDRDDSGSLSSGNEVTFTDFAKRLGIHHGSSGDLSPPSEFDLGGGGDDGFSDSGSFSIRFDGNNEAHVSESESESETEADIDPPTGDGRPAEASGGAGVLGKVKQAIKDGIAVMRDPDKRYYHGFGISSTTTSTPIRSNTWTPQPKPYKGFRYDNDVAVGLQFSEDALPPGTERAALRQRLVQLAQDKGLTEHEASRLTQSLKSAFGTSADPARDALAALDMMLDTSLVDGVRTVGFRQPPRPAGIDGVWTLAQHIVTPASSEGGNRPLHDDIGVRLIGKLAVPSVTSRPAGAEPALAQADASMVGEWMAVFLRASREALAEADPAGVRGSDPASVFATGRLGEATQSRSAGRNWPGRDGTPVPNDLTRAQKALLAVKNQLTAWSDHVSDPARAGAAFAVDKAAAKAMKPFATTVETPEPTRVAVSGRPEEPAMTHPVLEEPSRARPREAPPELEILSRLNSEGALKAVFDENPDLLRGIQRPALFEALSALRQEKVETEGLTPEQIKAQTDAQANKLTGPETVMLTHALDLAFGKDFDPAGQALIALRALQCTNLLDGLRQVGGHGPASAAPEGADGAWRLAQEIVQIPGGVGKSLIAKLTPAPAVPRDPRTHASVADKERLVLNVFLKASQRLQQETVASAGNKVAPALKNDPASIFSHGRLGDVTRGRSEQDWPGRDGAAVPRNLSIAQKALLAVRDELRALDEHAGDPERLATPFTQGTHGCRFAIPMIRNGIVTDESRDLNGKPSEFRAIESRLGKGFGKHVDRAMRNPTGWSKFKSDLRRIVSPFTGKSPFVTHNRIAEESPARGMGVVNQGGTHAARAQADMMEAVAAAIDATPQLKRDAVRDDEHGNGALRLVVRAEIARQVKAQALFMTRHSTPKRLLNFTKEKLIGKLVDELAPSAPGGADEAERAANQGLRDGLRTRVASMVDQENQELLTPHTLLRWAADIGGPGSPIAAQRLLSNEAADPRWRAFSKDFMLLTKGSEPPIAMEPFQGKERKDVADMLAKIIAVEELGSAFSFDNAGNVTVTTKGIQDTITAVLSGFMAKVHIDLGGGFVRTVQFESSNTTDRSQVRVTVQTLKKVETGVGGSLGTGPVPLKGSVDLGYAYDVVHQEGAVLGFPRNLTGGSPGDRAASERKAELVKLLVNHPAVGGAGGDYARPGNEEDRRSLIKSAFHAFGDDLSIGYFEQTRSDHTGSGSLGGVLGLEGLDLNVFGHQIAGVVGAGIDGRYEGATMRYRDRSGFLRTERDTSQGLWHGGVHGGLTGVLGLEAIDPDPHASPPDPVSDVLGMPTPLYSARADVWRKGVTYQSSAIVQDGEEHPTSYATHTYLRPADFIRNTRDLLPEMAEGKSRKFFGAEHNHDDPAIRAERLALEEAYLKEFSAWAVSQRDTTATPQIYYEFDASVATSNQLRAYEHVMARSGRLAEAKQARSDIETIHADPRYREAHFVTYPQHQQEGRTAGVNGIFGVTYAGAGNRAQQVLTFT